MLDLLVSGLCRQHGLGNETQVCFGISVSNFMCMSFVAVGKSLTIFSYIAFRMSALWFWAMFYLNPPIAPCYPLLWGGGILVDHWSTISNCSWSDILYMYYLSNDKCGTYITQTMVYWDHTVSNAIGEVKLIPFPQICITFACFHYISFPLGLVAVSCMCKQHLFNGADC